MERVSSQWKFIWITKSRVSAIIKIPDYKAETFGRDLSEMLQS